ncbi:hypothetical protein ACS7SF_09255 [Ralstonia sp. 25C]|uniref:hypothetical protein n=1 Tax=Ralstonia sp. 25C TaxID=3447363 RepID=UPI003F75439B
MRVTTLIAALVLGIAQPAIAETEQASSYVKAGMPAPSRVWGGDDYAQALRVLQAGTIALPRFADHDGAAILSRMTATENLALCYDAGIAILERYDACLAISGNVSRIIGLYYVTIPANAVGQAQPEAATLAAYGLFAKTSFLQVQKEWLAQQPKDNSYATRAEAVKRSEAGFKTAIAGAVKWFIQGNTFSAADRSVVLKALSETLPTLTAVLTADDREELRQKLVAAREKGDGAEDRARIDAMLKELEGAPKKPTSPPPRYKDA